MEAWCAYQERCQFEVNQKLLQYGLALDDRNALIAHLIEQRFLDEERFAEAYVSGKFRIKRWGKIKIQQHLKQKHISSYSINKAMNQISTEEYYSTVMTLMKKKASELPEVNSLKAKSKIYAYIQSKGFEFDVINLIWEDFKLVQYGGADQSIY